ncbi:MAG: cation:proton antiporter [Rhodoferax sp.]|nr:cation:proton antiporter [Rhodoferax sp.]
MSYLTAHSGLSMALGAFVGGMLISETIYRHQVEADIRPFRDILLGLFFVTVGMMLDLRFVFENLDLLALAVLLLIGGKALVILVLTWFLKTPLFTSLRTAAQLAQAGEFGLVLINLAFALHLIPLDVFQITLSAMLLSMFIAPFLIKKAASLAVDLGRGDKAHSAGIIQAVVERSADLHDHVLLRHGRTAIADMLRIEAVPFVALDADPQCIRVAQARGLNVALGNADRAEVLDAAGLGRAKVLVVSSPDSHSAERVIRMAR